METVVTKSPQSSEPLVVTVQHPYFDDNMAIYRVGCCHVRNWAYFTGVYDIIMFVFFGAANISVLFRDWPIVLIGIGVVIIVNILLFIILYKGVKSTRGNCFLTYLVIYWIIISIICISFMYAFYVVFLGLFVDYNLDIYMAFPIVIWIAVLGFRLWLQVLLHKTLRYLRDKERYNHSGGTILSQPVQAPVHAQTVYGDPTAPQAATQVFVYTTAEQPASPDWEAGPPNDVKKDEK